MPVIAKLSDEVAEMLDIDPKTGRIRQEEDENGQEPPAPKTHESAAS